jgi:hypothetical protein
MRRFALVVVLGLVGCRQDRVTASPSEQAWGAQAVAYQPATQPRETTAERDARIVKEQLAAECASPDVEMPPPADLITALEAASVQLGMTIPQVEAVLHESCSGTAGPLMGGGEEWSCSDGVNEVHLIVVGGIVAKGWTEGDFPAVDDPNTAMHQWLRDGRAARCASLQPPSAGARERHLKLEAEAAAQAGASEPPTVRFAR